MQYLVCDWRDEGAIHIVPDDGKEHTARRCWCAPESKILTDETVVTVHNLIQ